MTHLTKDLSLRTFSSKVSSEFRDVGHILLPDAHIWWRRYHHVTVLKMTNWTIDMQRGIAEHNSEAIAYFDTSPTPSLGLRVMGPWFQNTDQPCLNTEITRKLVNDLEGIYENCYVVLGDYELTPKFEEHRFPIFGSSCGFVPTISSRTLLSLNSEPDETEWPHLKTGLPIHRSGLDLRKSNPICGSDLMVVHPETIHTDLALLTKIILGENIYLFVPPSANWTIAEGMYQENA